MRERRRRPRWRDSQSNRHQKKEMDEQGKTDEAERNVKLRDEKQSAMQVTSFFRRAMDSGQRGSAKGLVFLESDRKSHEYWSNRSGWEPALFPDASDSRFRTH